MAAKKTINMKSKATSVKGQGVGSAYLEQVDLVQSDLNDRYTVYINRAVSADIQHYHTINPTFFLELPFVSNKSVKVGYVHFLPETLDQSIDLPKLFRQIFYKYVLAFYKRMDRLVTVNPVFIDKLAAYGIDRSKVTYIPNYVSSEQFFPFSDSERTAVRDKYGLAQDAFVVLTVGQLQTRKGIFDLIEIARRMPQVTFAWAGGFSFKQISDGYKEIQEIVKNPPDNVKFLGMVDRADMNGVYNLADVMFLPSFSELFPMAILEAMNCKKPILLRDLDLYPDILFDFYLKGSSVDEFCSLLDRLHTDNAFYESASDDAWRGHIMYSREHVAELWRTFYDNLPKIEPRRRGTQRKRNS